MSTTQRCPECGGSLAHGLADGLCPACLLGGLDARDEPNDQASEEAPPAPQHSLTSLLPIPGYTVVAELARGGMGIVYRARQHSPEREVALKMLLPFSASSQELRERFQLEARTLSELDHSAILPIYETGEHEGLPWFSMKLATGGSLADRAHDFLGRWREIAQLIATLADAVQFAHERGVLHRDLKPGNILFDAAERAFVADFGLAKLVRLDSDFTHSQRVLGTPHYLAPEVAASSARHATTASDVYSLGAILFEMLAGRPPFEAEGLPALLKKIVEDEPVLSLPQERGLQPASVNESTRSAESITTKDSTVKRPEGRAPVPRDLEVITLKCLAKDPVHRYASARELAEELRRFLVGEPILARLASPGEKLWRWSRRKPALASALGACALILIAGVAGILWQLRQTEAAHADAVQKARDEQAQRTLAETARAQAERSELTMRQNLYAADVLGAQRALEQNDLGTARLLLDAHRPAAGQTDLRGFEWRYFRGKTRPGNFLTLTNQAHEVSALAFSSDGAWLAFGSRQVLLYDATSFQFRARADVPSIQSIAFVPGEQVMVLGIRQMEVHRWDWSQEGPPPVLFNSGGRWPNVVVSHKRDPITLAVGTDASITGQKEGTTALYYSVPYDATGKRRRPLPESGGIVAFSPDGKLLATGSWQGKIMLWNPDSGTLVNTLTNANRVVSLRFSPDCQTLVACSFDDGAWLYEIATGAQRPVARGHTSGVWDAEISPDGRTLATGSGDQTVRLWDLQTGQQKALFLGHSYRVSCVAWSPDGKILASGGQDGTVRLWKVEQAESPEQPLAGWVKRHCFSPNGRLVAVTNPGERVTLHEYPSLKITSGPRRTGAPLGFLPDGKELITIQQATNGSAEILRRSVPDFQPVSKTALPESTEKLVAPVLSPDGRWLAAGLTRGEAGLWDLSGATKMARLAAQAIGLPITFAFSPDSQQLAGTFMDSTVIHLWELSPTPRHTELGRHPGFILHLIFSSDGRELISADSDKFIKVWDLAERKELATLLGHRAGIVALDISPDGKTVASSSSDRTVRLWNVATRREVARFEMESVTYPVAFASDGNALLVTQGFGHQPETITSVWRAPDFAETDATKPGIAGR